jgi:hypothetical protein
MKINVELSPKSIQEAIKKLQFAKKQMKGNMMKDFLEDVCMWIINRANMYLDNSDIGEFVKADIKNGWEYEFTDDGAKLINRTEKSVFVEFGVGVIGETDPHPNASAEGYEYNVQSESKSADGSWSFFANTNELDLPTNALLSHNWYNDMRGRGGESGKRLFVMTKGTQGVMYAYNAIVDARNDLQNPNGELAQKWKALEEKYIERYIG